MKKKLFLTLLLLPFLVSLVSACELNAQLISQDPYPAVPGDYVKVVFQITGVSDPDCGLVSFTLDEQFPFSLDPGVNPTTQVIGGVYAGTDFESFLLAPYRIRVDEKAVDGDNEIDVILSANEAVSGMANTRETFQINVEASDTDFEISVKDYQKETHLLTLEVLNTGENDIEALTIEIPKQENIQVKGSNRNIVGSLDSNEDTTLSFEAIPKDGEINLKVFYTDKVNVRREIDKKVKFDSSYFTDRVSDKENKSVWFYLFIILLFVLGFYWFKKNKKSHKHRK